MAAKDNASDISDENSDNDEFDFDDVGTKKQRYDETPSDANDDFDFDAADDKKRKSNDTSSKAKQRNIVDSDDDSDEDKAPQFVNWKMKQKQQRQQNKTEPTSSDPPAVKRYDSDSDDDTKQDDDDESAEESRERSQYNNYYEYDLDLEDSDTKKEHESTSNAPITPITPYNDHLSKPPKSSAKPAVFSTYIEPLQDAPEPDENPEPVAKTYDDLEQKEAPKYNDNRGATSSSAAAMTVDEFNAVSLREIFENDDSLQDHFDIAKKICKYFDDKLKDKNAVCVVSEPGKQPAISYWVNGDYVRKETNVAGKDILLYRAISHKEGKKPIVSSSEFQAFVTKISTDYEDSSVDAICDMMDDKFGKGCHYARSKQQKPEFDIYARFSDKYDASFRLPSGAYVIAWRR